MSSPPNPEGRPRAVPELDPGFRPAALEERVLEDALRGTEAAVPVRLAVEHDDGVFPFDLLLAGPGHPLAARNGRRIVRCAKFLLWSRGGHRILVRGPGWAADALRAHFRDTPAGAFDADIMGRRVYGKPFEVVESPGDIEAVVRSGRKLGGHRDGCRIGFDLGASDRKAAAVRDGEVLYTEEIEWDPSRARDPAWHFGQIMASLKSAAARLPRVDAIGGSSAGLILNNRVRVASLFRSVPPEEFERRVAPIFLEIQAAWDGIPMEVVNDGEVTALGAAQDLAAGGVLGIALGSSEAAGYVTAGGGLAPWLNELAFAPIDERPDAPADEWSGDIGCGVQYLSQQAVGRLLRPAGIELPAGLALPEKLVRVQELMKAGDPRAARIYRTLGCFLGHAVAQYARFYAIDHVLILGRVTSGEGGGLLLDEARRTLREDYPGPAEAIRWHTPDERSKRHGQAVTAAGLAEIPR